jgi:hypothetical protein
MKSLFLLLCCLTTQGSFLQAVPPSYVTVCSEGNQLGGQLTTFAVVLGYAWSNGLVPYFPREMLLSRPGGSTNYEYIFHRLPQSLPLDGNRNPPRHVGFYTALQSLPYYSDNVCICGMPDYPLPYFHPHREKIRKLFGPSEEIIQELRVKYASVIDHPKTVAVHVRAYSQNLSIHMNLGKKYYRKAMDCFSDDHLFVIFSDRIGWCKDHLDLRGKNAIFIEGNKHVQDLYLMSLCKNIITANSTFSWWAAYLKQDEEGVILVPSKWFPNEDPNYRQTFYPSHYTVFPVDKIPPQNWNVSNYSTTSLGD